MFILKFSAQNSKSFMNSLFVYFGKKFQVTFWAFILAFLLISGCRKPNQPVDEAEGLSTKTLNFEGQIRRYAIYVPPNLGNTPAPLLFELHGGGVYIEDMTGESGHKTPYKLWMRIADTAGFIVVYPEGLNGSYGKPTWNDCRANCTVSSHADDVGFINELIDLISAQYPVDPERIYVSGMSNGGLIALRLATELSDKIAAVSTVGASMPDSSKCPQPQRPISIIFMNGTADQYLPYNGGTLSNPPKPSHGSVFPVEYSVKYWVKINNTDTIPEIYTFPDLDPDDGGIVTRYTYKNGTDRTEVILYKIGGGGHSAPSIAERYSSLFEYYFGKQNHDLEMTAEVWKFFKDKRLKSSY